MGAVRSIPPSPPSTESKRDSLPPTVLFRHEVKNLLSIICANAEWIGERPPEDAGPAIHDILFACARLKKLADEVELTPRPIVRIVK